MKAVQWAPSGNAFDGIPSEVVRLLATDDGKTFGYGYGEGRAMVFRHERGEVSVLPRQWVIRHDDGTVTVSDADPTSASEAGPAHAQHELDHLKSEQSVADPLQPYPDRLAEYRARLIVAHDALARVIELHHFDGGYCSCEKFFHECETAHAVAALDPTTFETNGALQTVPPSTLDDELLAKLRRAHRMSASDPTRDTLYSQAADLIDRQRAELRTRRGDS